MQLLDMNIYDKAANLPFRSTECIGRFAATAGTHSLQRYVAEVLHVSMPRPQAVMGAAKVAVREVASQRGQ